jgi:hypothetical protein
VYRVQGAEQSRVCVNVLSPEETIAAGPARREAASGGAVAGSEPSGPNAPSRRDAEGMREIWTWFVLAAVLLSAVEWLLYARQARA